MNENWLDMAPSIAASVGDDLGFCVSDCRAPGFPLVYVSSRVSHLREALSLDLSSRGSQEVAPYYSLERGFI